MIEKIPNGDIFRIIREWDLVYTIVGKKTSIANLFLISR
jgi:hypothetical protein